MTNLVYVATSLDGFIADSAGGVGWLNIVPNPTNDDLGFSDVMNSIDAVVMGRKTFESVIGFDCPWPYKKHVFVLSNTLDESAIPEKQKGTVAIISGGTPKEIVKALNDEGFHNLYIDGGKTIQGFLEADLIDEMTIARIPILLGRGIPLFSTIPQRLEFKHVETKTLLGEIVSSKYKREK